MTKNFVISLCLVIASASVAFANSTIYTDDIGRMHFLGKDPGGPTVQQVQNFSNPAQKDLTDIIYKNADSASSNFLSLISSRIFFLKSSPNKPQKLFVLDEFQAKKV